MSVDQVAPGAARKRKWPWVLGAVTVVVALIVGGVFWVVSSSRAAQERREWESAAAQLASALSQGQAQSYLSSLAIDVAHPYRDKVDPVVLEAAKTSQAELESLLDEVLAHDFTAGVFTEEVVSPWGDFPQSGDPQSGGAQSGDAQSGAVAHSAVGVTAYVVASPIVASPSVEATAYMVEQAGLVDAATILAKQTADALAADVERVILEVAQKSFDAKFEELSALVISAREVLTSSEGKVLEGDTTRTELSDMLDKAQARLDSADKVDRDSASALDELKDKFQYWIDRIPGSVDAVNASVTAEAERVAAEEAARQAEAEAAAAAAAAAAKRPTGGNTTGTGSWTGNTGGTSGSTSGTGGSSGGAGGAVQPWTPPAPTGPSTCVEGTVFSGTLGWMECVGGTYVPTYPRN